MRLDDVQIGASEAAEPIGLSPYRTPFQFFARKVGLLDESDDDDNEAAKLGLEMEPVIAARFEREHDVKLVEAHAAIGAQRFYHPRLPWFRITPDRLIVAENASLDVLRRFSLADGEVIPVEIKTTGLAGFKRTSDLNEEWGAAGSDKIPVSYAVQVQSQILGLDAVLRAANRGFCRRAIVKALIPGRSTPEFMIEGDAKAHAFIERRLTRFVEQHLLPEVPPDPKTRGDFDTLLEAVRRPGVSKDLIIPSTDEIDEIVMAWAGAKEMRKEAELLEKRSRVAVERTIGEAYAIHGRWGRVTFSLGKQSLKLNKNRLADEALALMQAEAKGSNPERRALATQFLALVGKHTRSVTTSRTLRATFDKEEEETT